MAIIQETTAPPRKSAASQRTAVKKTAERENALNGILQITQAGLIATRQLADASAVGIHGPNITKEIAKLADSDAMIARVIDPLIKVGPYTALVGAVLPLVAQIAVNHKMAPAGMLGTVSGELLENQMLLSIRQQEAEVQRQREEVERQMREMEEQHRAFANSTGHGPDD